MKLNISELKTKARGCLDGRYMTIIFAYMMARLLTNLPSLVVSSMTISNGIVRDLIDISIAVIVAFITTIFVVGQNYICLKYARSKEQVMIGEMWYGFQFLADKIIVTYLSIFLRLLGSSIPFIFCTFMLAKDLANPTWMLASIVTGIVMLIVMLIIYLDYTLVFFLMVDQPEEANPLEYLTKSKSLMKGHRLQYLGLQASFLGMYLLALLTFGIGIFWVYPYVKMTVTEYYLYLIDEKGPLEQLLEGKLEDPNYFKEVIE